MPFGLTIGTERAIALQVGPNSCLLEVYLLVPLPELNSR